MRRASSHRHEQPSTQPSATDKNSTTTSQKVLQEGDRANPWVDLVTSQVFLGDSKAQAAALPPPIVKVLSALKRSQKLLRQQHSGLGAMTTPKTASKEEQSALVTVKNTGWHEIKRHCKKIGETRQLWQKLVASEGTEDHSGSCLRRAAGERCEKNGTGKYQQKVMRFFPLAHCACTKVTHCVIKNREQWKTSFGLQGISDLITLNFICSEALQKCSS